MFCIRFYLYIAFFCAIKISNIDYFGYIKTFSIMPAIYTMYTLSGWLILYTISEHIVYLNIMAVPIVFWADWLYSYYIICIIFAVF